MTDSLERYIPFATWSRASPLTMRHPLIRVGDRGHSPDPVERSAAMAAPALRIAVFWGEPTDANSIPIPGWAKCP
jgi:hypothetical protein